MKGPQLAAVVAAAGFVPLAIVLLVTGRAVDGIVVGIGIGVFVAVVWGRRRSP